MYRSSDPITIAVWGDTVVGRALVLLLRGSGYDAKFLLPTSSLIEPEVLEGVQLLLVSPPPMLSTKHRKDLLASFVAIAGTAEIPVLELVTASKETRERKAEARDESWHVVPWPCSIEVLEQRIEATLAEKSLRGAV